MRRYYKEVDSTNEVAKKLAFEGAPENTVVIAEVQKKGRGRMERAWVSPKGGVWLSIILRPDVAPADVPKMPIAAGVAVAKTLNKLYKIDAKLKWPNDILIKEKKVGGALAEMAAEIDRVNYVVVGIGINANLDLESLPPEVQKIATTLKRELGKEISKDELVDTLLEEFEKEYRAFKEGGFASIKEDWKKLACTLNREVRIITQDKTIEGRAFDMTDEGSLLVREKDGSIKKVISGDCIHI